MSGVLRMDALGRAGHRITLPGDPRPLRATIADRFIPRAVGMLGTRDLADDEVLILVPCCAVHAVGMRCAIGAAFVDHAGTVLRVVDPLPWWGARTRGAHAVIEAAAGVLVDLAPGDTVRVDDVSIFPHRGNSAVM